MIDEFAKDYLHNDLREVRKAMLSKLDGLSEYDVRRPLTPTGTDASGIMRGQRFSRSTSTPRATSRGGRGPT